MSKSDLVITHSGVGTIINAINLKKPIIVFPRLKMYKEHVDNHQLEIAKAFAVNSYVICFEEGDDLFTLIQKSKNFEYKKYVSGNEKIIKCINEFLR